MLKRQHESVSRAPDPNPMAFRRPGSTEASKESRRLKNSVIESVKKLPSRAWVDQLQTSQPVPFNTDKSVGTSKNNDLLSETPKFCNNGRRKQILVLRNQYTEDSTCKPINLRKQIPASSPTKKARPKEKNSVIQFDNKLTSVPCMDNPGPSQRLPIISCYKPPNNQGQNKRNNTSIIQPIKIISKAAINKLNDDYLVDPCTGYRQKRTDLNENSTDSRRIIIINRKNALNKDHTPIKEDLKNSQTTIPRKSMQIKKSNECKRQSSNNHNTEQNAELKMSSYIPPTTTATPTALHPAPMSAFDGQLYFFLICSLLSVESVQTPASNSEKLEDAMELIVEDRDYMERIEKDNKMKCVLCAWCGSRLNYEDHCRQDHSELIATYETDVWTMKFSLGSLFGCFTWLYHIVEYKSALYMIYVKYQVEDDSVLAVIFGILHNGLIAFNSAQITTMETDVRRPYVWRGSIIEFSNGIPDNININCFKNELSRINLIPVTNNMLVNSQSDNILPEEYFGFSNLDNYNVVLHVQLYNIFM